MFRILIIQNLNIWREDVPRKNFLRLVIITNFVTILTSPCTINNLINISTIFRAESRKGTTIKTFGLVRPWSRSSLNKKSKIQKSLVMIVQRQQERKSKLRRIEALKHASKGFLPSFRSWTRPHYGNKWRPKASYPGGSLLSFCAWIIFALFFKIRDLVLGDKTEKFVMPALVMAEALVIIRL